MLLLLLGAFLVFYGASIGDDFYGLPSNIGTVAAYVTVIGGVMGISQLTINRVQNYFKDSLSKLSKELKEEFSREIQGVRKDLDFQKEISAINLKLAVLTERTRSRNKSRSDS